MAGGCVVLLRQGKESKKLRWQAGDVPGRNGECNGCFDWLLVRELHSGLACGRHGPSRASTLTTLGTASHQS